MHERLRYDADRRWTMSWHWGKGLRPGTILLSRPNHRPVQTEWVIRSKSTHIHDASRAINTPYWSVALNINALRIVFCKESLSSHDVSRLEDARAHERNLQSLVNYAYMRTHARTTSYHAWAERIQGNHFSWLFRHLWLYSVLALACTLDCGCKGFIWVSSTTTDSFAFGQCVTCPSDAFTPTWSSPTLRCFDRDPLMTRHAKRMRGDRSLLSQYWRPLVATSQLWKSTSSTSVQQ